MKSEPATFGPSSMFPANAEGFMRAMDADYRVMVSETIDWSWERAVDFGQWEGSRTLWFNGHGQLGCNIQRAFMGAPMLKGLARDWRLHFNWVNLLGNPSDDDAPLLEFRYVDRSSFQNGGLYAGPIGMVLGNIGYSSQITLHNFELHRCRQDGAVLAGFRKVVCSGVVSVERNGLQDPSKYPGFSLIGDPATVDRGQSWLTGIQFEHDAEDHVGLYIRNAQGIHVGGNRHMLAGYDIQADHSTRYRSVVYGDTPTRFVGSDNVVPLERTRFGFVREATDLRLPHPNG